jgi:hypothetical protein
MPENKPKSSPARAAIQREAAGEETITVRYQGLEFTVPAEQEDWPTEAVEAFQEGRHIQGTKILLGPAQWAVFNSRFPKLRQFGELTDVIARALGFQDPAVAA